MKKHIFGRQFKRDTNERKALFKGLMTALVIHERIQTTEEKAKAIKGAIEKLLTKAIKQGAAAERLLLPYLPEVATKKMIGEIAPRFTNRPGGYTRIIRLGNRFQDNASMVVIEWVEKAAVTAKPASAKKGPAVKQKTEEVAATTPLETTAKKTKRTTKPEKVKSEEKKPVKKTTKKGAAKA